MSFAASVLVGGAALGTGGLRTLLRRTFVAGLTVQAAGCALLAVGGIWALVADETAGDAFTSAFDSRIGIDGLSGLFLGILGAVGVAALVFAPRYLEPSAQGRRSARSPACSCSSRRSCSWPATRSRSLSPGSR